jgi:hypothetical protein
MYQTATKLPNGDKIYQMAIGYIYQLVSFQSPSKIYQKFGFLVGKHTTCSTHMYICAHWKRLRFKKAGKKLKVYIPCM